MPVISSYILQGTLKHFFSGTVRRLVSPFRLFVQKREIQPLAFANGPRLNVRLQFFEKERK
jgi:hypothetical protein